MPCRTGPPQGCAVPPILPSARSALPRASHHRRSTKSAPPRPARAAPPASLTRPGPAWPAPSVFQQRKERTMIALYDHIQELRAELRGCYFTRRERAAVQAELATAIARASRTRPRIRPRPRGAAEPGSSNRGRRMSGPLPAPCSGPPKADRTSDLLDALEGQTAAAQSVIENWARGDLASAVRRLDTTIATARAANRQGERRLPMKPLPASRRAVSSVRTRPHALPHRRAPPPGISRASQRGTDPPPPLLVRHPRSTLSCKHEKYKTGKI